jgi:hypothetical protein
MRCVLGSLRTRISFSKLPVYHIHAIDMYAYCETVVTSIVKEHAGIECMKRLELNKG